MKRDTNSKIFPLINKILTKLKPRFSLHYVSYTALIFMVVFSVVHLATATTPNPGHPWVEVGDGNITFADPATPVTYTGPTVSATLLTTANLVTVPQGGTGVGTFTSNGIVVGAGTGALTTVINATGSTLCLTQVSSGTPTWGSCSSGGITWDAITNPVGDQNISFDAGEETTWTIGATTATNFAMNANSLTSGTILSLSSSAAANFTGTLGQISLSDATGASSNTGSLLTLSNLGTANANTAFIINHYATGTNNLAMRVNDVSGDTTPFVIDGNGNVGIGTTAPASKLVISKGGTPGSVNANTVLHIMADGTSGSYAALAIEGGSAGGSFIDFNDELGVGAGQLIYDHTDDSMQFRVNGGSEKMRIDSAGRVGIGETVPTAVLHLKAGTTTASSAPLKFTSGSLNTTAEVGAVEFLTDKLYATITTAAARKELTLNDIALTSGRIPFTTTNGRLTDNASLTYNSTNNLVTLSEATYLATIGFGATSGSPYSAVGSLKSGAGFFMGTGVTSSTTTNNSLTKTNGSGDNAHFFYTRYDRGLEFHTGITGNPGDTIADTANLRWYMPDAGHFLAGTDNTYDIGASGATRPRTGYFGTSVITPALTISGISGSTQCLEVDSSGVVSGTGVACGSGGSTAWDAIGDPSVGADIAFGTTAQTITSTATTQNALTLIGNSLTSGRIFGVTSSVAANFTGSLGEITLSDGTGASSNTGSLLTLTNAGTANANTAMIINHYATGSGNLAFRVNDVSGDTTPFIIDGAGNVGIGTSTAGSTLTVVGNSAFTTSGNTQFAFSNTTASHTGGLLSVNATSSSDFIPAAKINVTQTASGSLFASYGLQNFWTSTAVVTGGGVGQNAYGIYNAVSKSGADTATGTYNLYGSYNLADNTGRTAAGTVNTYGGYFSALGDTAGASTAMGSQFIGSAADTNYGIHTSATGAGTTNYGIYATATGATNNYAGYFVGDVSVTGHILPGTNDTYDLGSDSLRWRDLYLGGETLHIGTSTSDEGSISYTTSTNILTLDSTGTITLAKSTTLAGSQSFIGSALSYVDLGAITQSSTANQGLRLPNAASATPSNPTSGEGYLAWDAAGNQLITYNGSSWSTVGGGGGSRLDQITAANTPDTDNDNLNNNISWAWSTATTQTPLTLTANGSTTGSILSLTSSSAAATTGQKGLNVALTGALTGAQTTYGGYFSNTRTGASAVNVGAYFTAASASGANYAAIFDQGNVGIGTTTPTATLEIGGGGSLKISGGTSSGQGNIQLGATASAAYDTNLLYLSSTAQTGGYMFGSTPVADPSNGPYFIGRGNTYSAIATQRGNMYIAAGNPSTPAAGEGIIGFYTGAGSPRMTILNGGNIGIGDTTPASLFTVGNTDLFQINTSGQIGSQQAPVSDYLFAITGTSGNDNSRVIDITQSANDITEDLSSIFITSAPSLGSLGANTRNIRGSYLSLTPSVTVNNSGIAQIFGDDTNISLSSVSLATSASNGIVSNTKGNSVSITGTPTVNDPSGAFQTFFTVSGVDSTVALTPSFTNSIDTVYTTYGGNFSNSSTGGSQSGILSNAYGVKASASGALTTTSQSTHYAGHFSASGTADTNYGVYTSATAATTNMGGNFNATGAATTNYGIYATASGGTTNYAGIFTGGSVGIGLAAPTSLLHIQQFADSAVTATPVGFDLNSVGAAGELTASSGVQTFARIAPTLNQTSTAGYTALLVNATETATGSGAKLLQDWQVGGVSMAKIDNAGALTVTSCTGCGAGGGGIGTIEENNSTVTSSATIIDFLGADFNVTGASGEGDIAIDYTNSGITRRDQNEAITGDWGFTLGAGEKIDFVAGAAPTVDLVSITNAGQGTTSSGVDGLDINFVTGDGANLTNSAINVTLTNGGTAIGDITRGLTFNDVTPTAATEIGLYFGTGYDSEIQFADLTPTMSLADNGTLILSDGSSTTNDIFSIGTSTSRGNALVYGDITLKGSIIARNLTGVIDVFIYDTANDADSGEWRNSIEMLQRSWASETKDDGAGDSCNIATDDRCGNAAFPRKAIIATTADGLYIFDGADNSLWMKFTQGGTYALGADASNNPSGVAAQNGVVLVGTNGASATGLYAFDFKQDVMYRYNTTNRTQADVNIGNRNSTATYSANAETGFAIINNIVNDVSVNMQTGSMENRAGTLIAPIDSQGGPLLGVTIIAAATDSGVSVINMGTRKVVNYSDATNDDYNQVYITERGRMYATNETRGQLEEWRGVDTVITTQANGTPSRWYDETLAGNTPVTLAGAVPTISTSPSALAVIERASSAKEAAAAGQIDAGDIVFMGTNEGLAEVHTSGGTLPAASWSKVTTKDSATPYMNGSVRSVYLFDDASGATSTNSAVGATGTTRNPMDTAGGTSPTFGTSGIRGGSVNFNNNSYLCSDANADGTCDTDADIVVGTTSFTVSLWFKHSVTAAADVLFERCYTPATPAAATGCVYAGMTTTGTITAGIDDDATFTTVGTISMDDPLTSAGTWNDNQWHHLILTNTDTDLCMYIDGRLAVACDSSLAAAATLDGSQVLTIGGRCTGALCVTGDSFWDGQIDEFTWSAGATTGSGMVSASANRRFLDGRTHLIRPATEVTNATAFSSTTIGDSGESYVPNSFTSLVVEITGDTGAGQTRNIISNDATTFTVYPAWTVTPDATSDYRVTPSKLYGSTNTVTAIAVDSPTQINKTRSLYVGTNDGSDGGGVSVFTNAGAGGIKTEVYSSDSGVENDDFGTSWSGTDADDINAIAIYTDTIVFATGTGIRVQRKDTSLKQLQAETLLALDDVRMSLVASGLFGATQDVLGLGQGADLAEYYYSSEPLEAGDVVAIQPDQEAGISKSNSKYQKNLLGIISTKPGLILGPRADNSYAVALSGRVPVKFTEENGSIKVGDLLTSSSRPGYAMRATSAGAVIGRVLNEPYALTSCDAPLQNLEEVGTPEGPWVGGEANTEDDIESDTEEEEVTSETSDMQCGYVMLFVGLGESLGKNVEVLAKEFGDLQNGEATVEGITVPVGIQSTIMTFLRSVKANLASTADLVPESIFTDRIAAGLEILTPTLIADAVLTNIISPQEGSKELGVIIGADGKFTIGSQTITIGADGTSTTTVNSLAIFDAATNTATFAGQTKFDGLSFFTNTTSFAGGVTFASQVEFVVPPLYNKDSAGYALIKQGDNKSKIIFDEPYISTPVVNTSVTFESSDDIDDAKAQTLFDDDIRFIIMSKDQNGFVILLNKPATRDIRFSWNALAVKDPKVFESIFEGLTINPNPSDDTDEGGDDNSGSDNNNDTPPGDDTGGTGGDTGNEGGDAPSA